MHSGYITAAHSSCVSHWDWIKEILEGQRWTRWSKIIQRRCDKKKKYTAEQQDLRCELAGQICNNTSPHWQTHPAEGTADSLWSSVKAKSLSAQPERPGAVCGAHSTQTDNNLRDKHTHKHRQLQEAAPQKIFFVFLSPSTKKSYYKRLSSSKNEDFVINYSLLFWFNLRLFIYPKRLVWGTSQACLAMFLICFEWCSRYSFAIKA